MFELKVRSRFSAAHRLEGYAGKCATLHGHNWDVDVLVSGEDLDGQGILVDFKVLKQAVVQVLEEIDHRDLNEVNAFRSVNPTSENIARYLFRCLSQKLNQPAYRVSRVSVWETSESCASYWE
jgi:6-pyruvoyltetrahydropterin/6-carboxytetrahydropterin synthase